MKYSKGFERDYNFYLSVLDEFNFCGTLNPKFEAIPNGTLSAKECFYFIESEGKNKPCSETELLNKLLLTKASINFQIKEWAQSRADGTLPLVEFSKRRAASEYPDTPINEDCTVIEWVNNEPICHRDIETQYGLPEWVVNAVERQKYKFYKKAA
jgi:hypothetical protein